MKILSVDATDTYNKKLIIELNAGELGGLSTGFDSRASKAGDVLSLAHALKSCSCYNQLGSTEYHLVQIEEAIAKFRVTSRVLGLIEE